MNETEKKLFVDALNGAAAYCGSPALSNAVLQIYWRHLRHLTLVEVEEGVDKHIASEYGHRMPLAKDIIGTPVDHWPAPNEAWAMVPKDESDSAATLKEIMGAWSAVEALYRPNNETPARMAFLDFYKRAVSTAKQNNEQPEWFVTLGHRSEGRHEAKVESIRLANMMRQPDDQIALPAPERPQPTLSNVIRLAPPATAKALKKQRDELEKIKRMLRGPDE